MKNLIDQLVFQINEKRFKPLATRHMYICQLFHCLQ